MKHKTTHKDMMKRKWKPKKLPKRPGPKAVHLVIDADWREAMKASVVKR